MISFQQSLVTSCMLVAGMLHIIAVFERYKVKKSLGWLFIGIGIAQVTYALWFYGWPSENLVRIGVVFNAVLLLVWALTQRAPKQIVGAGREPMQSLAWVRKLLEFVTLIALLI